MLAEFSSSKAELSRVVFAVSVNIKCIRFYCTTCAVLHGNKLDLFINRFPEEHEHKGKWLIIRTASIFSFCDVSLFIYFRFVTGQHSTYLLCSASLSLPISAFMNI